MVHSLRPVRLRQLTIVKKVFVQKSEIAQKKKKKKKNSVQIHHKKQKNFSNDKTANHQQISRKK